MRVTDQAMSHRRSPGLDTLPSLSVVIGVGVLLRDLALALLGALLGAIGVATILAIGTSLWKRSSTCSDA